MTNIIDLCIMNNIAYFEKGISFADYKAGFEQAVAEGRTSGPNQDEMYVHYTSLNLHRFNRLWKHTQIDAKLEQVIKSAPVKWKIIMLTEYWCGDAAQNIPILQKAFDLNPNIEMRFLFRDENLELMDRYLTNGGRSIPKMIVMDEDGNELFNWGPRPHAAQEEMARMKAENVEMALLIEGMQRWYNADKGQSLQAEILAFFSK